MNKEYIINHFINLYYKSFNDIDLASDDKEYIEHISINETLDIIEPNIEESVITK